MKNNIKFNPGQILMTCGIRDAIHADEDFGRRVVFNLYRHLDGDWGDCCDEDAATNTAAISNGDRIFSVYKTPGTGNGKIWIITEADRSATTILFPSEY